MSFTHIKVRVFPDSREEQVTKLDNDSWRVFLKEPAKAGLANKRLVRVLFDTLDPRPRTLRIVGGEHSPNKVIEIQY